MEATRNLLARLDWTGLIGRRHHFRLLGTLHPSSPTPTPLNPVDGLEFDGLSLLSC